MDVNEYNRRQREANLPPECAVTIEGAGVFPSPDGQPRVKIALLDHKNEYREIHASVPNAMYLFAMLRQLQADLDLDVPKLPPVG